MTMTAFSARIAMALIAGLPVAACAQPAAPDRAAGLTLDRFVARGEARQMAADTDGDGRVSHAEYLAAAGAAKTPHGDPERRFARIDRNRDGFLDKSEIDAGLAGRFHRLDADGDGVLTPQERAAAHHRDGGAAQRDADGA